MTSTDLRAVIDRDARRRKMLTDPDLTGDMLLFTLALDEVITVRREQGRKSLRNWVVDVTEIARGDNPVYRAWGKGVIAKDTPRYAAEMGRGRPCAAPMIRREGLCGKAGGHSLMDYDPATGAAKFVHFCARHKDHTREVEARQREWVANGRPHPPANTGGVLRRYFAAPWDRIYFWASGREPMEGGREATPPRPTLRLIQGGSELLTEESTL